MRKMAAKYSEPSQIKTSILFFSLVVNSDFCKGGLYYSMKLIMIITDKKAEAFRNLPTRVSADCVAGKMGLWNFL